MSRMVSSEVGDKSDKAEEGGGGTIAIKERSSSTVVGIPSLGRTKCLSTLC